MAYNENKAASAENNHAYRFSMKKSPIERGA